MNTPYMHDGWNSSVFRLLFDETVNYFSRVTPQRNQQML